MSARLADASTAMSKGEWLCAIDNYRRVLELNPSLASVWVQLGHALKESGEPDEAISAYEKAAGLEPSSAEIYLHLGHLLKNLSRPEEAADAFTKCLIADPKMHDAYDQLLHLGWARRDILAVAPAIQGAPESPEDVHSGSDLSAMLVYEAVRQMTAIGHRPRRVFPQNH